jgi:hypothetical protein
MRGRFASFRRVRRREETHVTDDKSPDSGAGPPHRGPARKKRRERSFAPPVSASASGGPNLPTGALLIVLLVGFVVVALWIVRPDWFSGTTRTTSDKVFDRDLGPTAGTTPEQAAAVDAKAVEKRKLAESLFGPELFVVKDREDFAEEPQWRKVVEVMSKQDPAAVTDRLELSLNNHYDEVLKDPDRFRGRFVRMRGIVANNFGAKKLSAPISGERDVYRGWIKDPDEEALPVVFDVLEHPPFFRKMYDAVDVDGVFYRLVRYETRDVTDERGRVIRKGKWVDVPWIVGRTVSPCQPAEQFSTTGTWFGAMTAFLALVVAIVYLVRRGRRPSPAAGAAQVGFRSMFAQRLREERPKEPPSSPGTGE